MEVKDLDVFKVVKAIQGNILSELEVRPRRQEVECLDMHIITHHAPCELLLRDEELGERSERFPVHNVELRNLLDTAMSSCNTDALKCQVSEHYFLELGRWCDPLDVQRLSEVQLCREHTSLLHLTFKRQCKAVLCR